MKTIHKYPIPVTGYFTVGMPQYARILHFAEQRGQLCLWALVDTGNEVLYRHFILIGTGHPIDSVPPVFNHVGTVVTRDGNFVWHLFDLGEGSAK